MLARVLPVAEVIQRCSELGFGVGEIFALCGPFSADFNAAFYHQCRADVVITKASGAEGDIRKKFSPVWMRAFPASLLRARRRLWRVMSYWKARPPLRSVYRAGWPQLRSKNEKALLVVSFGTSYHDTCEKTLWRANVIWRRPVPIATCFAPSLPE